MKQFTDDLVEKILRNISIGIIKLKTKAINFLANYKYDTPIENRRGKERIYYPILKMLIPEK